MNTKTLGLIVLLAATLVAVPASADVQTVDVAQMDFAAVSDGCTGPVVDCIIDIILDACRRLTSVC